ncbi:MAG: protein-glutamate O-methyltransferase family protein, partial [Chloroflexales bacterium]|nr:protein-glutamate O-methyltransferase family protein [Chloroflexales bacterium]
PPPLRGADPDSYAQDTIVRRVPAIGRRVLAENELSPAAARAVAALAAEIPATPVRPLNDPGAPDLALWEGYIAPYAGQSWLEAPWFFAETYFYRRVLEATGYFQPGPGYQADPFALQKRLGLAQASLSPGSAQGGPISIGEAIQGALWGNQADLSLWPAGEGGGPGGAYLLADDTAPALAHLDALIARRARVDIVLDNAGAELVHDLALADALLARGLAVVLHAKAHPTFVSDTIEADLHTTLAWLSARQRPGASLGERLGAALDDGRLKLRSDWYWTSPLAGWELPDALRRDLAASGLMISKGDANYRRWLGDRHWPFDAPLAQVLAYAPAPLLLLRACKAEVVAGLDRARIDEAAARDPRWITSGRWGVIQLHGG